MTRFLIKNDPMKLKNYIIICFTLLMVSSTFAQNSAQRIVNNVFKNSNVKNSSQEYFLTEFKFNSKFSDFGAFEYDGNIYFTSSRDEGSLVKHIDQKTNEPFLDIYVIDKDSNDTLVDHKSKLKGDVNTIFHEGSLTITKDGKTMYFSRNDFNKNELGTDDNLITHLKIYAASLVNDKWINIKELPFNGNNFSNVHPALNEDETKLYFSSDMKGSIGGSDIYYVDINVDGTFGNPQNLGNIVNTKNNERFPFINNNGKLFFASDGHSGMGMLDIYETVLDTNNNIIEVSNLGEPVNSAEDDFSFFINSDGLSGYFASNRTGGIGSDDIYAFNRIPPLKLEGTITDSNTNKPIQNAEVSLLDNEGLTINLVKTNENGYYEINIARDTVNNVTIKKDAYIEFKNQVSTKDIEINIKSITSQFVLIPKEKEEIIPIVKLNPIYFDFNQTEIKKESTQELDRIVNLMVNKYPNMVIKIESHSDSRGTPEYNHRLSEKRAITTYKYLVNKGVKSDRIAEYKGYGEQYLLNKCNPCSKEQHKLNRRTQFIIVDMN